MKKLHENKLKQTYHYTSTILYYLIVRIVSRVWDFRNRYQSYIYHIGTLTFWLSCAPLPLPISALIDLINSFCEILA